MVKNVTPYANSIFEQPWWLDIVASGKWEEIIIKDNGEVIARFPYYISGKAIVLPPFTQTMGIWIRPDILELQKGNAQLSRQKEIIAEIMERLPPVKAIDIRLDANIDYILPFRWQGFRIEPTFSYRIDNLENLDSIYQNLNKTVKKNLKVAKKNLILKESEDIEVAISLLDKTFEIQNRFNTHSEIEKKIISNCIENGTGKLLIAYQKETNEPCSFSFLVYDENRCYYLFGGTDFRYSKYCGSNMVLWEGIKYASSVSKCFDFEGSMVEGIENLFRQYGGKRAVNYRIYRLPVWREIWDVMRPHIKHFIGYKI